MTNLFSLSHSSLSSETVERVLAVITSSVISQLQYMVVNVGIEKIYSAPVPRLFFLYPFRLQLIFPTSTPGGGGLPSRLSEWPMIKNPIFLLTSRPLEIEWSDDLPRGTAGYEGTVTPHTVHLTLEGKGSKGIRNFPGLT
jgi:hypothetical protein